MKTTKKLALASAIATLTTGASTVAFGAVGLEEIVVTARKREESIQSVPVAVTAVTGETFERSLILNLEEATALTPGFAMSPATVSVLAPTLAIRGSQQNAVIITNDPSVGIYVDGVYIARPYGVGMDLLDVRDIQVLKGPQGTLFGRNSTAGALLLRSADPILGEFSGSASITAGDILTASEVVLNVPLGDMFAFRLAHRQNEQDDYIKNEANDPNNPVYLALQTPALPYTPSKTYDSNIGGFDNDTTRAKLLFAPSDNLEMVLSYEEFETDHAGPARDQTWISGITIDQDEGDDTVSLSFDPRSWAQTETTIFNATYDGDFGELKLIYSYREFETFNEADYDGGDWAAAPAFGVSLRQHGSWGRIWGEQDSLELQWVTSFFDDKLDVTVGGTWFQEDAQYYDYSSGFDIYAKGPGRSNGGPVQEVDALGLYTQATYHIDDISNLTVGLRRSEEDKDYEIYGTGPVMYPTWDHGAMHAYAAPGLADTLSFDSTDWLVSYDRQLSDDVMAYGKVSTGFRSGGVNGRPVPAGQPQTFAPEELIEYELGLKGEFMDGKLRSNTSIYMNETTDKQFSVLVPPAPGALTPSTISKNAGKAEAQGFETEFTYLLSENWSVSGSYAYVDVEIVEQALSDGTPAPDNRKARIQNIPENEWTLSVNYDQEFESFNLRGTAMYHWVDEKEMVVERGAEVNAVTPAVSVEDAENWAAATRSEAHGLLNMNLTVSTPDDLYSATFWSKNVLDERAHQSGIGFILSTFYQYGTATYTPPRSYGVTLKARF